MKIEKIFLIPYSTLEGLVNETTQNSQQLLYRSAKIVWTKKNPFEYIVPPPLKWVGTISGRIRAVCALVVLSALVVLFLLRLEEEYWRIVFSNQIYWGEFWSRKWNARKYFKRFKWWTKLKSGANIPLFLRENISVREQNFLITCGFLSSFFFNFSVIGWLQYCINFRRALIVVCRFLVTIISFMLNWSFFGHFDEF